MLTSVFVTVVPMLAPMIIGTAASTLMVPAATSPTIVDVDTEDDWTSTVASTPTKRPARGLLTLSKSCSSTPLPRPLIPASSTDPPTRNR